VRGNRQVGLALGPARFLLRRLRLRTGASAAAFLVADGAALWLSPLGGDVENGGKLGINCFTFGDEVFDVRNVRIDIQCNHLLSSAVMRLKVPLMRWWPAAKVCSNPGRGMERGLGAFCASDEACRRDRR